MNSLFVMFFYRFSTPIILAFIFTLTHVASAQNIKGYAIRGRIDGIDSVKVLLSNAPRGYSQSFKVVYYDSCVTKNGYFEFKGIAKEPGFYTLSSPDMQGQCTFIVENSSLEVAGDKKSMSDWKVIGSKYNDQYQHYYNNVYVHGSRKTNAILNAMSALRKIGENSEAEKLKQAFYTPYYKQLLTARLNFIKTTPDNYAALFELYSLEDQLPPDTSRKYYKLLSETLQHTALGKNLRYWLFDYPELIREKQKAPEFSLADTSGRMRKLSDLKGKYVLVDFWASWCGPCIEELPAVKKLDSLYREKGLVVLGISLDDKRTNWTKAIIKHKIPWMNVSDLEGGANKAAVLFKVEEIPSKFLLAPDGTMLVIKGELEDIEKFLSATLGSRVHN